MPSFFAIHHTHWDREWYRSLGSWLPRWSRTLDEILNRLEGADPPACIHLDGQTVLVEDYLALRPTERERICRHVSSGRLAVGPWYVLADELLSSAEALQRNLRYGCRDADALGMRLPVGYSPDAFGHPAALPSLLRGFGIGSAVVWRGVPDRPGDRFRWRAPDGAEVFVAWLPPNGYETPADLAALAARASGPTVPVFVGKDHTVPQTDRDGPISGVPGARLDAVLDRMSQEPSPAVEGELRDVGPALLLSGVTSTRASLKRATWAAGVLLERIVEPLLAWAGHASDRDTLDLVWRWHLQNHFHDTLCGTVSDEVAEEAQIRAARVASSGYDLMTAAWDRLIGHDPAAARRTDRSAWRPAVTVFNPAATARSGVVIAEVARFVDDIAIGSARQAPEGAPASSRGQTVLDETGRSLGGQVLGVRSGVELLESPADYPDQDAVEYVRIAFEAPPIPGLGVRAFDLTDEAVSPGGDVRVGETWIENAAVRVDVNPDGSGLITDKRSGETFAEAGSLWAADDRGDAYTAEPGEERALSEIGERFASAHGPVIGEVTVTMSTHEVRWRIDTGSPLVRLTVRFRNELPSRRLRLRVPTGIGGEPCWSGGAFGPVVRSPMAPHRSAETREMGPDTFPVHRAMSAARGRRGLTMLVGGCFEGAWDRAGVMSLTLLRGIGDLSRGDLERRVGHVAWIQPIPGAQELGEHQWTIGFFPHDAAMLERYDPIMRAADEMEVPLQARNLRNALALRARDASAELEGEGLVFSSCHPSVAIPGAVIVRCYNATDRAVAGVWRFGERIEDARVVRLDETELDRVPIGPDARCVHIEAPPRGVVTLRVRLST